MNYNDLKQNLINYLTTDRDCELSLKDLDHYIKVRSLGRDQYFEVMKDVVPYLVCPNCNSKKVVRARATISMEFHPPLYKTVPM